MEFCTENKDNQMNAAVYKMGKRIEIEKRPVPNPEGNEICIRTAYCGVCGTDIHIFNGNMDARTGNNRVIGHEMSGVVHRTGSDVKDFKPGEKVVIRPLLSCNACPACKRGLTHICENLKFIGIETDGAFQEYMAIPENLVHHIPDSLDLLTAALIEPIAVACHDIRCAGLKKDDIAVVIGAGPIGLLIGLAAKARGVKTILSDIDPYRLEFAQKRGLEAINPQDSDVRQYVYLKSGGAGADIVFETSATKPGLNTAVEICAVRGKIVNVGIFFKPVEIDLNRFFKRELQLNGVRVYEREDFEKAIELCASGKIPFNNLITSLYPIKDIQSAFESIENDKRNIKTMIKLSR